MTDGYIQIYTENYVCSTISNVHNTHVLVTGEKQYLKKTGMENNDCMQMVSQTKYINVLGVFAIPNDKVKKIFRHAKDKVLDAYIMNGNIKIIGDHNELLYHAYLDNNLQNLNKSEIILTGSKPWLSANNLEYF